MVVDRGTHQVENSLARPLAATPKLPASHDLAPHGERPKEIGWQRPFVFIVALARDLSLIEDDEEFTRVWCAQAGKEALDTKVTARYSDTSGKGKGRWRHCTMKLHDAFQRSLRFIQRLHGAARHL